MQIKIDDMLNELTIFDKDYISNTRKLIKPNNEFVEFKQEEINQSIVSRFELQVEKNKERIAVKSTNKSVSYEQLNSYANRIAHNIVKKYNDRFKLNQNEKERYKRQMLLDGWGVESQEKLKSTAVFVAGAGGSGSAIIQQLALCGFGTIIVCDFDKVELSNLNRQILHDESRIGMNKALSAEMTIKRINPNVNVVVHCERVTRENVFELVGEAEIIFDNVDDLEAKFILSECAVRLGIPHIISSMIDINSYAAVFHTPKTPCFHCLYDRNKLKDIESMKAVLENYQKKGNTVVASSLFLSTGFAVNEALKIILGFDNPAYNRYFLFNQKGTEDIVNTDGYSQITFPFSEHFKKVCKEQGFDWDKGWRGNFLEELAIRKNDVCPVCGERFSNNPLEENRGVENKLKKNEYRYEEKESKKNQTVALLLSHDVDMVIGIMGVLKSGKIYVPLDPTYPKDRLAYMLDDSECRMIVTNNENEDFAIVLKNQVNRNIVIINIDKIDFKESMANLNICIDQNQIAYILYTSGSTGLPKGIMQSHRNVLHFISAYTNNLHISSEDRLTLLSSYSFDAAVMDIYGALLNGAVLYPFSIKKEGNIYNLVNWIKNEGITIYHSIPTVFRYLVEAITEEDKFPYVRLIVMGGEVVYKKDVEMYKKYFADNCIFINGLGPTESTVTLQYFINKETSLMKEIVPVGFPVAETQVYLINGENREVGSNEVGEIVYESDYLAIGYWNNEEKTKEVFVNNPLTKKGRVYKTGDLGKRLNDGSIEFIGRKDFQVKIRGYRIELEEIEGILDRIEGVSKSIVISKRNENKEDYILAYYVKEKNVEIDEANLKHVLGKSLPEYMVPSVFKCINKMPLTASGKIDRKALVNLNDVEVVFAEKEFEGPRNLIESKLVEIWKEVLRTEKNIDINDKFLDIGGHSLKATKVIGEIHKKFNVEVPLTEIFKKPTVKQLAEYIKEARKIQYNSIEVVEEKECYSVSSAQKRMYMLQELDKDSTAYNISGVIEIHGKLDIEKVNKTFLKLIKRHESLRTSFEYNGTSIMQKIHEAEQILFNVEEKKADSENEIEERVRACIKSFDLSTAPLIRASIIKLQEQRNILVFDMHHIISDGTSIGILSKEFGEIYGGREREKLRIQYKDYSEWQNELVKSDKLKKQEEYWLKEFEEEVSVLNLPTDYKRSSVRSFKGDNIKFTIGKEETIKLREISLKTESTMYMVLLSTFKLLLSRYSGQDDIIVGSPAAGRQHSDTQRIVGMFVNTLAIRSRISGDSSYEEYLKQVKEKALNAYENQDYQFEDIVEKLRIKRDLSRNPIFDIMFTMQNIEMDALKIEGLSFKPYILKGSVAKFDITMTAVEGNDEIYIDLEYAKDLYTKETIERMKGHYLKLVEEVGRNSETKIKDIDIIGENEKKKLLEDFNNTKVEYPKEKTLQELFEEQVEKTPDNVAVVFKGRKLTYKDLNDKANSLASVLREKGIREETIVGIMVERSIEMVVGIIGILKAGGAYLPIDPDYPEDRIKYILEDSKVRLLLVNDKYNGMIIHSKEILNLNDKNNYTGNKNLLEKISLPEDLAYVIYTSGTTGMPKGVGISHTNIVNYVTWFRAKSNIKDKDKSIIVTSLAFDLSYTSFYSTLLSGGEVHIVEKEMCLNPEHLIDYIAINNITFIKLTPSQFNIMVNSDSFNNAEKWAHLKFIAIGGEPINVQDVKKVYETYKHVSIMNHYGPTETTIGSVANLIEHNSNLDIIPIGKPINNASIYILDKYLHMLPIGIVGEIYIGGAGIAKGYRNKKELTKEKFLENPYKPGEKIYRTGDLARWLFDGNIEFLGRIDNQVKIRGFRIELGEIEEQLLKCEHVKEAIIVDRKDKSGNKYLCAYYTADRKLTVAELRSELLKNLSDYMVPSYFIQVDKISLTPNGKIDRKELPEPDGKVNIGVEYEEPRNEIEQKLQEMWGRILGIEKIGINDNFFELGGHSIKAISLVSMINNELNIETSVRDIFTMPIIKTFANHIINCCKRKEKQFKYNNVLLLRKGNINTENLFIIHDGSGDIGGYIKFCNQISLDINCWGIKAQQLEGYSPQNRIVEEIAEAYIKIIKNIQPTGVYNIAGWSLGGVIAFEIVKQLAQMNEKLGKLVMFDSYIPHVTQRDLPKEFTVETEKKYIKRVISNKEIENEIDKMSDIGNIWTFVIEYLKKNSININEIVSQIPMNIRNIIPSFDDVDVEEIIHILNMVRTLENAVMNYKLIGKINMQAYFFKAAESQNPNISLWNECFTELITLEKISGNHYTIFELPNVNELAQKFSKLVLKANLK